MKNLYEVTGDIKDINTLLVNKKILNDFLDLVADPLMGPDLLIPMTNMFRAYLKNDPQAR